MFDTDAFRNHWAPRLISVVRIFLGLDYMQHGLTKYFGFPGPQPKGFEVLGLIGLAGALEIVGGLMMVLGIYTRWVAFILSGEMAVAYLIARHRFSAGLYPLTNGGELEAVYCFFFFLFFLVGGGAWSLDRRSNRS
jgi:putative oxidoreductase